MGQQYSQRSGVFLGSCKVSVHFECACKCWTLLWFSHRHNEVWGMITFLWQNEVLHCPRKSVSKLQRQTLGADVQKYRNIPLKLPLFHPNSTFYPFLFCNVASPFKKFSLFIHFNSIVKKHLWKHFHLKVCSSNVTCTNCHHSDSSRTVTH